MARSTTGKERKEVAQKTAAREVKQFYSTEVEDREAEPANLPGGDRRRKARQ
jgi:hypothetical protein